MENKRKRFVMESEEALSLFSKKTLSSMEQSEILGGVSSQAGGNYCLSSSFSVLTSTTDPDWCDRCACPKSSCRGHEN
ncbi:hypothetical protein CLV62_12123 [Dysgonomonas alginatilytica]|uniref:Uncharacterized protein n=1 Tax=Dysgonomonas alginatilytica TaxID=1605892 RepID=A0A2V3PMZ9_9BACT|nr:hypothetical protein CLV62_12123 [Dysgonomonas alginatilytica]